MVGFPPLKAIISNAKKAIDLQIACVKKKTVILD